MAVKTKDLPSPVLLSTCLHGKYVRPIRLNGIAAFTTSFPIGILTQSIPIFRLMEHPEEGGGGSQNDRNVE